MNEYKPNSSYYKEEKRKKEQQEATNKEKKVEKVVTGKVKTRKKSSTRKFIDEFISEDAKSIKSYVFGDVLVPALKKAIDDIVTNGISIILYGESGRGSKRSTADRVSYRSYYDTPSRVRDARPVAHAYSYDDIILDSRGEAQDVLQRMDELMETYGLVRVADLYDLVGITGNFTDNKYGWTNIRNAEIVRVRDGYMIKMPRAVPID